MVGPPTCPSLQITSGYSKSTEYIPDELLTFLQGSAPSLAPAPDRHAAHHADSERPKKRRKIQDKGAKAILPEAYSSGYLTLARVDIDLVSTIYINRESDASCSADIQINP